MVSTYHICVLIISHSLRRSLLKAKNMRGKLSWAPLCCGLCSRCISETCIKGHRSSACKHTDRPLFEIKKKGRPVTQCEHCRELRKTKQVHVKCICELKNDANIPKKGVPHHFIHLLTVSSLIRLSLFSSSFLVGAKVSESAAFPNGLPDALALEASVAYPEARLTISDQSIHGGMLLTPGDLPRSPSSLIQS